jgi:hypothetical protein
MDEWKKVVNWAAGEEQREKDEEREHFRKTWPVIVLTTAAFGGLGFIIQGMSGGIVSTMLVFFAVVIVVANQD